MGVYNRYIPQQDSCTPVEPPQIKREPDRGREAAPPEGMSPLLNMLAQSRKGLEQWLRPKAESKGHGLAESWKELGLDRGDLLLGLILLLLLTQEEEGDLLLALGAAFFLDKDKKKQGDE